MLKPNHQRQQKTHTHTNLQHSILQHTPTDTIQISTIYCPNKKPSIELLNNIIKREKHNIIAGDFNAKHEDFGHSQNDKSCRDLIYITTKHNLTKPNDNTPTFTSDISGGDDVKDLIFSSPKLTTNFQEFWVDEDLGYDHKIIIANFHHTTQTHTTEN